MIGNAKNQMHPIVTIMTTAVALVAGYDLGYGVIWSGSLELTAFRAIWLTIAVCALILTAIELLYATITRK